MLSIATVNFDSATGQEPPAPQDTPPAVRGGILEAISLEPETVNYSGTSTTRLIRFAAVEGQGWLSYAQKVQLMNLYLSRSTFTVVTDLLSVRGTPITYSGCYFEPSTPPVFAPLPVATGDFHFFDLPIRMPVS